MDFLGGGGLVGSIVLILVEADEFIKRVEKIMEGKLKKELNCEFKTEGWDRAQGNRFHLNSLYVMNPVFESKTGFFFAIWL